MPVAPKSPQFKQHPFTLGGGIILLDSNNVLVDNVAPVPAADTLVVPPPPAYVDGNGGKVVRLLTLSNFSGRVKAPTGLLIGDTVQLIYKAEGGREVVMGTKTGPVAPGETFNVNAADIIMSPTDLGVFLRFTEAIPTGVPLISGLIPYADMRGPLATVDDITAVEAIVAGGDGNVSAAQLLYTNDTESDVAFNLNSFLINFDDVAHTFQVFVSNGTKTIEISDTDTPVSIAAGAIGFLSAPSLPPGWSIFVSLGEAVSTFAPRAMLINNTTNLDVARNTQAGAY